MEPYKLILFHFENQESVFVLEIAAISEVLANIDESVDVLCYVVDARPLVGGTRNKLGTSLVV